MTLLSYLQWVFFREKFTVIINLSTSIYTKNHSKVKTTCARCRTRVQYQSIT